MIDIHSHILWNVDDGCESLEETQAVLEQLRTMGFTKIIPTPHRFHPLYNPSVTTVKERIRSLQSEMIDTFSFEYMYSSVIPEEKQLFEFGITSFGSRIILLEFVPMLIRPHDIEEILFLMERKSIFPILAHIERYLLPLSFWEGIKSRYSVWLQGGLKSLGKGPFDSGKRNLSQLLKAGLIDNLATDIHSSAQLSLIDKAFNYLESSSISYRSLFSFPTV